MITDISKVAVRLIDRNGRFIPLKGMKTVNPNTSYYHIQPEIDYGLIYDRLVTYFPEGTKFVTREGFAEQGTALIAEIRADMQMSNLLKGPHLPICLPELPFADYGQLLENLFLWAVERSYKQAFPKRQFSNWRKGELSGKVTVVDERHQELIERMQEGPVVGVYFADSLRGFGIEDCRKMARQLPKGYTLSGGFDAATAFAADPQTLARDYYTPATDCAALSWQSDRCTLCLSPRGEHTGFVSGGLGAGGSYSAGLLFTK